MYSPIIARYDMPPNPESWSNMKFRYSLLDAMLLLSPDCNLQDSPANDNNPQVSIFHFALLTTIFESQFPIDNNLQVSICVSEPLTIIFKPQYNFRTFSRLLEASSWCQNLLPIFTPKPANPLEIKGFYAHYLSTFDSNATVSTCAEFFSNQSVSGWQSHPSFCCFT